MELQADKGASTAQPALAPPGPVAFAPWVVFVLAALTFASRAAPGVSFDDSGELAAAAATLGVPHPPGFPLYVLAGRLWLALSAPFGDDPARLLNLFSACCAAGAAALMSRLAVNLGAGLGVALAVGALPCLAPSFAAQAVITEVYAPAALLQAALLVHVLGPRPRAGRTGLLLGLGAALHPASLLLSPVVLLPLLGRMRARGGRVAALARGSLGLFAGLSLYVYVPLAARRDPALNWGEATGGARLWEHLSRRQFAGDSVSSLGERLGYLGEQLACQWPLVLVLALGGLALLRGRGACLRALLLALVIAAAGLFISSPFALEESARWRLAGAHLPLILLTSALAALGLIGLEERLATATPTLRTSLLWPVLVILLAMSAGPKTLAGANDQSGSNEAALYAAEALGECPEGAALLISRAGYSDVLHFPLLYAQLVLGQRSDVLVLDREMLPLQWYRAQLARRHPELAASLARLDQTLRELPPGNDPRSRRLASLPFVHALLDGPRPVAVAGRISPKLLGDRQAVPGVALWHVAPGPQGQHAERQLPPLAESPRAGSWLPEQDTHPWIGELRRLARERDRERARMLAAAGQERAAEALRSAWGE